jgi:hypothetical protein
MTTGRMTSAGRTKLDSVEESPCEEVVDAAIVLAPDVVVSPAALELALDCPAVVTIVEVR